MKKSHPPTTLEGISSTTNVVIKLPHESCFTIESERRIIKSRSQCNCTCCIDSGVRYDYEILKEEIKSTQKSIAHCKEDTNKILSKVEKLEAILQ